MNSTCSSGNNDENAENGKGCLNNNSCSGKKSVGPIPRGPWTWTTQSKERPDRYNLTPANENGKGRTDIQTHACVDSDN